MSPKVFNVRLFMKAPAITQLSKTEISNLVTVVNKELVQEDHRAIVAETLEFCRKLIEDLKQSRINIHQLKQMLGFHSEQLKKGMLKK